MSTLKDYSDNIASSVHVVEKYLAEKNLPQPSYDVTSPKEFPADAPPEVQQARINIIEQARELYQLAQYPNESAVTFLEYGMMEAGCLRALHELGVFDAIPQEPGSFISLTELAKVTKLENLIDPLDRMVGRLRVSGILREPKPGHIAHTSISINYAAGQPFNSEIGWFTSIGLKSMALMSDQMQAFRDTVPIRSNSAFNLAFNTPLHFMEWMTHHPVREKQFCDVMDSFFRTPPFSMRHIVAAYPWSTLGPAHLVDVGGNAGLVSIELAKAAPQMRFTVQDQPSPVALGRSTLPPEFADRITFETHDFFTPNPQNAPDFFLLRHILHDWPDAEAGKIVKHMAAQMGPHTKLLIYDSVHQKLRGSTTRHQTPRRLHDVQPGVHHHRADRNDQVRVVYGEITRCVVERSERFRLKQSHCQPRASPRVVATSTAQSCSQRERLRIHGMYGLFRRRNLTPFIGHEGVHECDIDASSIVPEYRWSSVWQPCEDACISQILAPRSARIHAATQPRLIVYGTLVDRRSTPTLHWIA